METTNALSANELRRSVTEGNSAGRPRETNHGFANIFEGRQLGGVNIARRFQVNGPSSLGQTSKVGRVAGLQTSSSLKQSETAPSLVLDSVAGAVDSEGGRQIGRPSAKDAETSSALNEATSSEVADPPPLRMINTGLKTAAPLPDQDTASHLENAPKQQLESRRSHTLTKRILRGAIELKAVVFSSSPLAKTKESKKELAEQRAKKRKEGTVVFATGKTSGLDSVTEKEVAESLEKLERGAFAELRIVNEDAFKEHMAFLRDPEQKQRVSTYRTLAGRILSEYLTLSETQNSSAQASKPSANQSQTLSFNPSEQSRAPSNEAAKPSDQQSPIAQNQTEIPPEPLLTPSNQGPKPTVQCTECWLPQESCMCREVFRLSRPLWPGMRVWMLMHSKEYRRKNNTGKVMWQLFGEESVRLSISGLDILEDEMWKEFAAAGPGRVFLMYPERKAQETMEIFYIDTLPLPSISPQNSSNPTSGPCDTATNSEALNHAFETPSSSSKPPSLRNPSDGPVESPACNSDFPPNHQRNPSAQTPYTSETPETLQPPETLQTFQTSDTLQTRETFQTPETLQTPEILQTPPVSGAASGGEPPPVHFVFLDGTWNNSTAMLVRLQQQAERVWGRQMACLCLTPDTPSKMHSLRPQPALEKVCTAAAASMLLRELSERPELSDAGLSDAADTVDQALEVLVNCLQGWRARVGRSPTRGPNRTPAENWVPRERSRSRSPVLESQTGTT